MLVLQTLCPPPPLQSLCTQTVVFHIIRTSKVPFIESRPSRFLVFMSVFIVTVGVAVTLLPLGHYFGFVKPSAEYFLSLIGIVLGYVIVTQKVKTWYVKRYGY